VTVESGGISDVKTANKKNGGGNHQWRRRENLMADEIIENNHHLQWRKYWRRILWLWRLSQLIGGIIEKTRERKSMKIATNA
jgi:hypothetical protein